VILSLSLSHTYYQEYKEVDELAGVCVVPQSVAVASEHPSDGGPSSRNEQQLRARRRVRSFVRWLRRKLALDELLVLSLINKWHGTKKGRTVTPSLSFLRRFT